MVRQCARRTKAGKQCKASPLNDSDYCLAHSDQKVRDSIGFGGHQEGAGRPPQPRAVDVLRERLEARMDEVIDPLFEALKASRGIVVGSGEDAQLVEIDDHQIRITAVRELLDRAYGRPKQQTEISGPEGGPIELEMPEQPFDLSTRAAELLAEAGALSVDVHENGSENGHR